MRHWTVTRKCIHLSFQGGWCCFPCSTVHTPHNWSISVYTVRTVCMYVCIIKWWQSPWMMLKPLKKSSHFSASNLGCLDVRRCWWTHAGPHVHIRPFSYQMALTAQKSPGFFFFFGRASFNSRIHTVETCTCFGPDLWIRPLQRAHLTDSTEWN